MFQSVPVSTRLSVFSLYKVKPIAVAVFLMDSFPFSSF